MFSSNFYINFTYIQQGDAQVSFLVSIHCLVRFL